MLILNLLVPVHWNDAAAAPIHDVWAVYMRNGKGVSLFTYYLFFFLLYKDIDGWCFVPVSIEVFDPSQ
jgi:hypothetical protein